MPPSAAYRAQLVEAFDHACIWPSGKPGLDDAWHAIYQLLLWYAEGHIHIREANDLRRNKTWQNRATAAEAYIADALGLPPNQLAANVDLMMQLPRSANSKAATGNTMTCPHCGQNFVVPANTQRHNTLGNGLRILIAEILNRWGDPRFIYDEEAPTTKWFPGITLPGRTQRAKIDILARTNPQKPDELSRPRAVISCKWSARHDRMSDITNECPQYKSAAAQQSQPWDLLYFVVTNELDGQRSNKALEQRCMDALVMVHRPLAAHIGTLTPMMQQNIASTPPRLLDLTDLVRQTFAW